MWVFNAITLCFTCFILFFSFSKISKEFFVETICDGEPARTVRCPQQNVISTVWASYGRQHPDICVDGDQLINVTCKSDYDFVLSMVQETCDDTNTCSLESSKDEYGDPPECQGVKKYLQMYYLCKSGKMFLCDKERFIWNISVPNLQSEAVSTVLISCAGHRPDVAAISCSLGRIWVR